MSITEFLNIWFRSLANKKCECVLKTVHVMLHIKAATIPSQRTSHIQMANTVIHNEKLLCTKDSTKKIFYCKEREVKKFLSKLNVPLSVGCLL